MSFLRTTLLFGLLTALFLAVGFFIGGTAGMFIGLLFAFGANIISYWYSDKIVLMMYGAKPCSDKKINTLVASLAKKAGLPTPKTFLIDADVPNAFATGRDPNHAAVAVTRGLMDHLNEQEIRGVLAHELSHVKNRDTLIATAAATLSGALTYLGYMFMFGDERNQNIFSILLLFVLAPLGATLIRLAISRSREFGADASGALLADPESLASALEKISGFTQHHTVRGNVATAHLFIVNPFQAQQFASLFSTHPPTEERTRRLRAMQAERKV